MEAEHTDTSESDAETTASAPQADSVLPAAADATTDTTVTHRDLAEWHGKQLVDSDGERIGKLEDVYFDVETDEPRFGTVKEGLFGRHLAFIPLVGATIGPESLQVPVTKAQIKDAPDSERNELSQADESRLYHHYQLNYTPLDTESGRRLARR